MRCARFGPYKSPLRPTHALASRLGHHSAASTTGHPTLPYLAVRRFGGFSANGVAGLLATGAPINRDVLSLRVHRVLLPSRPVLKKAGQGSLVVHHYHQSRLSSPTCSPLALLESTTRCR